MVTHDISEATTMSDRILILKKPDQNKIKNQEIVKIDQPRTLFSKDKYNEAIKNSIFN